MGPRVANGLLVHQGCMSVCLCVRACMCVCTLCSAASPPAVLYCSSSREDHMIPAWSCTEHGRNHLGRCAPVSATTKPADQAADKPFVFFQSSPRSPFCLLPGREGLAILPPALAPVGLLSHCCLHRPGPA